MNELISVIVPVYNTAPYLRRCVESVCSQSDGDLELLLVDDGSTDGSGALCDALAREDGRIRVLHQANAGVSAARNAGLDALRGKYFLFLDSDDLLEQGALRACRRRITEDESDAVVFGWQEIKGGKRVNSGSYGDGQNTDPPAMVEQILADRHIFGGGYPNKFWKTETFREENGKLTEFRTHLIYVEDMEWVIRMLLKASRISLLDEIFYTYDLREDSVSKSAAMEEKRLIGYHDTMAAMVEDLQGHPGLQRWFEGVAFGELINSTIDARRKGQKPVYRALSLRLQGRGRQILSHPQLCTKYKLRYLAVALLRMMKLL